MHDEVGSRGSRLQCCPIPMLHRLRSVKHWCNVNRKSLCLVFYPDWRLYGNLLVIPVFCNCDAGPPTYDFDV
ncbi:hypothetical protein HAX54_023915, partial [Datura stramonium]|nr:hypothetical protein [Datura stramonium]